MLPVTEPAAVVDRGVDSTRVVGMARVARNAVSNAALAAAVAARAAVPGPGAGGNPLNNNRGFIREVQAPSSPPG